MDASGRVDAAGGALDQRHRAAAPRRARPRRRHDDAVRVGAVLLVGPVRREVAEPRHVRGGRRGRRRLGIPRRAEVGRAAALRRPSHRRRRHARARPGDEAAAAAGLWSVVLRRPRYLRLMDRAGLASALAAFERREHSLDGRRAAAVAMVVVDSPDGPGIVLTKRSARLRAHAGQWALPGGRVDADETFEVAALRELHEELGLHVEADTVLGRLDDYPTRSGYVMTPVVVWADASEDALHPNPDEVASAHVVAGDVLAVEPRFISIPESDAPVIQLPMLGTLIHAPTAAIVY